MLSDSNTNPDDPTAREKGWKILAWDSNFFDLHIGKVIKEEFDGDQLRSVLADATESGIDLLYYFTTQEVEIPQEILEQHGGRLVDDKVTFTASVSQLKFEQCKDTIYVVSQYPQSEPDLDLLNLAVEAGKNSRFSRDPMFSEAQFQKLYHTWIRQSTTLAFADTVLVARNQSSKISGFVTFKLNSDNGKIGLIAVDSTLQRQGIGHLLMNSAHAWMKDHKVSEVSVDTQLHNKQAMSFYQSTGYSVERVRKVYHFWLKGVSKRKPGSI